MGFFSKLFGNSRTPPANALSNTRHDKDEIPGGRNNPWVCEPPPNLSELRKLFRQTLSGNDQIAAFLPGDEDGSGLDSMIAEMVKMAFLNEIFGEEGTVWECGTRLYLQGSIQSQEIVFKDGRQSVIFYTDFSKFGAF